MTQRVVGLDLSVEARMITVDEASFRLHLFGQIGRGAANETGDVVCTELRDVPPPAVRSGLIDVEERTSLVRECPGRGKDSHLAVRIKLNFGQLRKLGSGIKPEVARIDHSVRYGVAAIEHGVGIDLLLEESEAEVAIKRQAEAEVVALGLFQARGELAPIPGSG